MADASYNCHHLASGRRDPILTLRCGHGGNITTSTGLHFLNHTVPLYRDCCQSSQHTGHLFHQAFFHGILPEAWAERQETEAIVVVCSSGARRRVCHISGRLRLALSDQTH